MADIARAAHAVDLDIIGYGTPAAYLDAQYEHYAETLVFNGFQNNLNVMGGRLLTENTHDFKSNFQIVGNHLSSTSLRYGFVLGLAANDQLLKVKYGDSHPRNIDVIEPHTQMLFDEVHESSRDALDATKILGVYGNYLYHHSLVHANEIDADEMNANLNPFEPIVEAIGNEMYPITTHAIDRESLDSIDTSNLRQGFGIGRYGLNAYFLFLARMQDL